MKTIEEIKAEYDNLMENCRAAKEQGNFDEAEYFFNQAQKVWDQEHD